jgi:hypothetical protein
MGLQIELEIVGLTDEASALRAEKAILGNTGVDRTLIFLAEGRAVVDVRRGYTLEHLLESLETAGFMARLANTG